MRAPHKHKQNGTDYSHIFLTKSARKNKGKSKVVIVLTWRGNTLKREQEIASILKKLLTGKNILKSFQYLKYLKKQSHDFVTQFAIPNSTFGFG